MTGLQNPGALGAASYNWGQIYERHSSTVEYPECAGAVILLVRSCPSLGLDFPIRAVQSCSDLGRWNGREGGRPLECISRGIDAVLFDVIMES